MNYCEKRNIWLLSVLCMLLGTSFIISESGYSHDIPVPSFITSSDGTPVELVTHKDLYDHDGNFVTHIHEYSISRYTQAEIDEIDPNTPHTAKAGDVKGVYGRSYDNPGFTPPDDPNEIGKPDPDGNDENYGSVTIPRSEDTEQSENTQGQTDTQNQESIVASEKSVDQGQTDTQNQESIGNQQEQIGDQQQGQTENQQSRQEYVHVVVDPHPDRIPKLQEGQVYFDSQSNQFYRIQNGQSQSITGQQLYALQEVDGQQVAVPVDTVQRYPTTYMILPSLDTADAPTVVGNLKLGAVQIDVIEEQIDLLIATGDRSPAAMRRLVYLQQLIAMARPEQTRLFANYPNPFNPETWIPYELATDTEVRITIYNTQGVVIRTLQLGQQSAGYYTDRERAAYWDGRNALGEQVASGIYFYQLETDTMSALRKMVILQ